MTDRRKDGLSILGVGVAVCVACCAGPILALLGGLSIAGLASTVIFGAAGLVITVAAIGALFFVRRRRANCAVPDGPVPVAAPSRSTRFP